MKEKIKIGLMGVLIGFFVSSLTIIGIYFTTIYNKKIPSIEYNDYQKKHGTKQRFFCNESEFLVEEFFDNVDDKTPTLRLILNGGGSPVHCVYFNKKNK